MSAIAAYRTAVLLLLSDATNIIFSNTEVDQAIRWAMMEYSFKRPLLRTYQFSVISSTRIHNLPVDFVTKQVTKVELWNAIEDQIKELTYYAYILDEQWIIETKYPVQAGEVLQITYSTIHQIDGLDAAAGTTIPLADEAMLEIGAAGRSAQMRAMSRVETINMDKDVVQMYKLMGAEYMASFISQLVLEPGITVSEPDFPGDDYKSAPPPGALEF